MRKYWILVVDDNTWPEHKRTGIAAINDPLATHPTSRQSKAQRQVAISEIIGIRPGDYLFFNVRRSDEHPPQLVGLYEATSNPYYDSNPVDKNAQYVNKNYPFRVAFKQIENLEDSPINIEEIWSLKETGKIWSLQQTRGDAVGKHACVTMSKQEGELILKLLRMNNLISKRPISLNPQLPSSRKQLQTELSYGTTKHTKLNYEAVVLALLIQEIRAGNYKDVLGDYDDFIPYLPLGSRKEIDLLLLKYDNDEILWYEIVEVKRDDITIPEEFEKVFQQVMEYKRWLIKVRAEIPLQVHVSIIAHGFSSDVIEKAQEINKYLEYTSERGVRLIEYKFNNANKRINLRAVL